MKRLTIAAATAALLFVVAPKLHAQATQQAKKADSTATTKKSAKSSRMAKSSTGSKSATSKRKARHAKKAKADTAAAKKSE